MEESPWRRALWEKNAKCDVPQAHAEILDLSPSLHLFLVPLSPQPHPHLHCSLSPLPFVSASSCRKDIWSPSSAQQLPFIPENCSSVTRGNHFPPPLPHHRFPQHCSTSHALYKHRSSQIAPFLQSVDSPVGPLIYWPLIRGISMEI